VETLKKQLLPVTTHQFLVAACTTCPVLKDGVNFLSCRAAIVLANLQCAGGTTRWRCLSAGEAAEDTQLLCSVEPELQMFYS